MLKQIIASDLLEDLSAEEQELLSGGQNEMDVENGEDDDELSTEFPSGDRVRRYPIRLTGILEVVKPKKDKED
ncbi:MULTISPECIES: hypothetical protein [unclassified Anabaena]|uniref:hypothetical protein n=1 Tax=unclassified Anabaena TaxID=2619674 RepID=UPI0039C67CC0